ncbi:hypothetical protein ACFX13_017743 [Malus domestica]
MKDSQSLASREEETGLWSLSQELRFLWNFVEIIVSVNGDNKFKGADPNRLSASSPQTQNDAHTRPSSAAHAVLIVDASSAKTQNEAPGLSSAAHAESVSDAVHFLIISFIA